MKKDAGILITLEGVEGSGTTTLAEWLVPRIHERTEQEVLASYEPGGTVIGNRIRQVLLDRKHTEMVPMTEALLFIAARAQLYTEVVIPNLTAGNIVLLDRSGDSTFAYQSYGHGLSMPFLRGLNAIVTSGRLPDLTILCDCPAQVGRSRKKGDWNRLDASTLEFLKSVRWGYVVLAQDEPKRWFVVDTTEAFTVVTEHVWKRVSELLV